MKIMKKSILLILICCLIWISCNKTYAPTISHNIENNINKIMTEFKDMPLTFTNVHELAKKLQIKQPSQ